MNPEKMSSIFQNINSVMEKKMEDGSLHKDDLKKEAEGMYGTMAQNPMFASMMGQMQGTGPEAKGPEAKGPEAKGPEAKGPEEEAGAGVTKEEARQRLKSKIKAKEHERVGKS